MRPTIRARIATPRQARARPNPPRKPLTATCRPRRTVNNPSRALRRTCVEGLGGRRMSFPPTPPARIMATFKKVPTGTSRASLPRSGRMHNPQSMGRRQEVIGNCQFMETQAGGARDETRFWLSTGWSAPPAGPATWRTAGSRVDGRGCPSGSRGLQQRLRWTSGFFPPSSSRRNPSGGTLVPGGRLGLVALAKYPVTLLVHKTSTLNVEACECVTEQTREEAGPPHGQLP